MLNAELCEKFETLHCIAISASFSLSTSSHFLKISFHLSFSCAFTCWLVFLSILSFTCMKLGSVVPQNHRPLDFTKVLQSNWIHILIYSNSYNQERYLF